MEESVEEAVRERLEKAVTKLEVSEALDPVALGRIEYLLHDMEAAIEHRDNINILFPKNIPPYPSKKSSKELSEKTQKILDDLMDISPSGFLLGRLDILTVEVHRVLANPEQVDKELGHRE